MFICTKRWATPGVPGFKYEVLDTTDWVHEFLSAADLKRCFDAGVEIVGLQEFGNKVIVDVSVMYPAYETVMYQGQQVQYRVWKTDVFRCPWGMYMICGFKDECKRQIVVWANGEIFCGYYPFDAQYEGLPVRAEVYALGFYRRKAMVSIVLSSGSYESNVLLCAGKAVVVTNWHEKGLMKDYSLPVVSGEEFRQNSFIFCKQVINLNDYIKGGNA